MPAPKICRVALAAVVLAAAAAVPAAAQGRPVGLRMSVVDIDHESATVDFEVELATTGEIAALPHGLLGAQFVTETFGYTARLLAPEVIGLDFGDGQGQARLTLPRVGPGSYRGSFRHTYPGPGHYQPRVAAAGMGMGEAAGFAGVAGAEPIVGETWRFVVFSPFLSLDRTFTGQYETPYVFGLAASPGTATPQGGDLNGGSGVFITSRASVDPANVPSASEFALGLLSLLLALAGWRLLALR